MNNRYFKYRQKFNIKHTIGEDSPHIHTLEINMYFKELEVGFKAFDNTQYVLDMFFESVYDGKFINELPSFADKLPTIENIGWQIFNEISDSAYDIGYRLVKLEIGENPSRLYVVSDYLITGELTEHSTGDERRMDRYISERYDEFVEIQKNKEKAPVNIVAVPNEEKTTEVEAKKPVEEVEEEHNRIIFDEVDDLPTKKSKRHALWYTLAALVWCVVFYFCINDSVTLTSTGDIYLHLGKGQYLMAELLKGRLSPIYMESWYDGYLMFMHCEPLAYYLLAFCGWILGESVTEGYILFLSIIMFIGAYGFIRIGRNYNRPLAGFGSGILWFIIPEMSRNYYITGDAKVLLAVSFLPLLYSYISEYYKIAKKRTLVKMAITVALIVISDLSVAMVVIAGLLLMFIYRAAKNHQGHEYLKVLCMMITGVGLSMAWIYSAYANGSIPDFIINREGFQGEIGVIVLLFLCMVLGQRNLRYISFIGIVAGVVAIYFVPQVVFIAYLALFAVIVQWKGSKRIFAATMLLVMALLCIYNLDYNRKYRDRVQNEQQAILEKSVKEAVEKAEEYTTGNLLYLDINDDSTYPAYYMTYKGKKIVFSNRSSARYNMISDNIAQLKYALYTKHFDYVFDRGLELSCDTFLIYIDGLNFKEADKNAFAKTAAKYEYETVEINDSYAIFHRDLPREFGVKTEYEGLAIGAKSDNISVLYPYFQEASKSNLMDYTFEELSKYKKIYVTDLQYEVLEDAESLVKRLADAGVEVYIDMDSMQNNPLTNRQVFLGCTAQSVLFKEVFPKLEFENNMIYAKNFYGEYTQWNTVYIENLDAVKGKTVLIEKELAFYGNVYNDNVHILSFNLPYHAVETQDESVSKMLDQIFELEEGQCPSRKIVNVGSKFDGKSIIIDSEEEAILGIAYQRNFEGNESIAKVNSLVQVDKGKVVIEFNYNSLQIGIYISVIVVVIVVMINILLGRKQKRR